MTIAGWATGCERGYVYLRGEYPRATQTLERAIAAAYDRGFLGGDVMGLGFRFDVEVRRGAGAYICGAETAIFNSIEGYRGEPRNKPPFPVEVGLFGKPTVVNNVETLVNVLPILEQGAAAYSAIGTERSTGTKLFAVSGPVRAPGVYEVPFGVTLADLLQLAGGMADFLIVPTPCREWLNGQPRLVAHIEEAHRLITDQQNVCKIYDLSIRPRGSKSA